MLPCINNFFTLTIACLRIFFIAISILLPLNIYSQTIHYVTSYTDDNSNGTLRKVINDAASGDTIRFANGINYIKLNGTQIAITKHLTIIGHSPNQKVTIDGDKMSRVFHIATTININSSLQIEI